MVWKITDVAWSGKERFPFLYSQLNKTEKLMDKNKKIKSHFDQYFDFDTNYARWALRIFGNHFSFITNKWKTN